MTWQTTYQSEQNCVSWQRYCAQEVNAFDYFLQVPVADHLHNTLTEHLLGLNFTGIGQDAQEKVLAEQMLKARNWTVYETLVKALRLKQEDSHDAIRQRQEKLPKKVWSEASDREGAAYYRKAWMIMDEEQ